MSLKARKELCESIKDRYRSSRRKEKKNILDEFASATGYHRKHAIRKLGRNVVIKKAAPRPPRAPRLHTRDVQEALFTVWKAANCICTKRLIPYLPTFVESLERHGHLNLEHGTKRLLLSLSAATADRILYRYRHAGSAPPKARAPGNPTLKTLIPVRTFDDWTENRPGYVEADLVWHCGSYAGGAFVNSFVLTDVETGWTECFALLYRDAEFVIRAFKEARNRFPFPVLGLDTDNGTEFITYKMLQYCKDNRIKFTRSRPWKKNDQCFIEQKNGHIVRRLIGYERFEGLAATRVLTELYKVIRLYVNFFQPSMRLLSKSRMGAKTYRKYDVPRTPYDRILTSENVTKRNKQKLRREYRRLDPVLLLSEIERLQNKLWSFANKEVGLRAKRGNRTPNDLISYGEAGGDGHAAKSANELILPVVNEQEAQPKRTYRKSRNKRKTCVHWWKSHADAFESAWTDITGWLEDTPYLATTIILERLQTAYPDTYPDNKLRTLQRRVKAWRLRQLERPEYEFSCGDSLPDADTIELVVHWENDTGSKSLR